MMGQKYCRGDCIEIIFCPSRQNMNYLRYFQKNWRV